jgi:transglutaminase-like putative cysteine protease
VRFPLLAVALLAQACTHAPPAEAPEPGTRRLRFHYEADLAEVQPGSRELRVWIPRAQEISGIQHVLSDRLRVENAPGASVTEEASPDGANRWWHVRVPDPRPGVGFRAVTEVVRHEQRAPSFRRSGAQALSESERTALQRELGPHELVPVGGRMETIANEVAGAESNSLNTARRFYDHVLGRMRYSKDGTGWGRGDSLWACDSGFGNCTDFHSLFMSLARSRGIPARFTMGFPIPEARGAGPVGGYHCWAEFYVADLGWIPVDISEADKDPSMAEYYFGNLTEDRISFTLGRDLELVPPPRAGRLNFLIYPHAEVDGAVVSLARRFRYEDF